MQIFIVRHADALPLDDSMRGDEERPLSDEGHKQTGRLASAFKRLDLSLERVLASPLKRARQTADELAQHLEQPGLLVEESEFLAPGGSVKKLLKLLRKLDLQNVALVGHEPDLGRLTARLVGGKRAQIEFAKGGMACVGCDDPPRPGA